MRDFADIENVLKQFRVSNNVFVLGLYEKRITVYSQQTRAFNLISNLFVAKGLKRDSKLGIIGAGIGGLTCAYSAALVGCQDITVFERKSDVLGMWKTSTSRFLHPYLFEWPMNKWDEERTSFPLLNWESGMANKVASEILSQHNVLREYFRNTIKFNLNSFARANISSNEIIWGDRSCHEKFDVIIIAIGFGYDGKKHDDSTYYWAPDNLEVMPIAKNHFFVSGNGDGGMADLLRIRIKDFSLNLLVKWLKNREVESQIEYIREIENNALHKLSQGHDKHEIEESLWQNYKNISTPNLSQGIAERLRCDTSVVFHGRSKQTCNINSFAINRFLMTRLEQVDNDLYYKVGEIENLDVLKRTGFSREKIEVKLVGHDAFEVNRVILRHGPKCEMSSEAFKSINTSDGAKQLRSLNLLDNTGRSKLYNRDLLNFDSHKSLKTQLDAVIKKNEEKLFDNAISFFSKEHFQRLNADITKAVKLTREELLSPNEVFKSENDYLKGLMGILPHLDNGAVIKAVCGNKDWDSKWVRGYFKMNYEAIERGVSIKRIFLLQDGEKGNKQKEIIREQKTKGIITMPVSKHIGEEVLKDFDVPSTFGFAVIIQPGINKIVVLHDLNESSGSNFTGVQLTAPLLVTFYENVWNSLFKYSKDYYNKYNK